MLSPDNIHELLLLQFNQFDGSIRSLCDDVSPSSIHRARVAVRRLETAITLCQDSVRSDDLAFIVSKCKRLRSQSNAIRDLDVLLATEQDLRPRVKLAIKRDRQRYSKKLKRSVAKLLQANDLEEHVARITCRTIRSQEDLLIRFVQIFGNFLSAVPSRRMKIDKLHSWRIAAKQLRYAVELLIACNCGVNLNDTMAFLAQLQNDLGKETDKFNRDSLLSKYDPKFKFEKTRSLRFPTGLMDYRVSAVQRVQHGIYDLLQDH